MKNSGSSCTAVNPSSIRSRRWRACSTSLQSRAVTVRGSSFRPMARSSTTSGSICSAGATQASSGVSAAGKVAVPEHLRKFETMVLQNFVKSMMPSESEQIYGEGTAGEMWRGMMADQLGEALGKGGGIGIAEALAKKSGISGGVRENDKDRVASGMVQSLQREAFADLTPGIKDHETYKV